MFLVYVAIWIIVLFLYCQVSMFKGEEWTNDKIKSILSLFIESEKEIGALEDLVTPIVFLTLVYSWFFVVTPVIISFLGSEYYILLISLPLVWLFIFCMPLSVLYDYGLMFACYLRGCGSTVLFSLEFMYDCLATLIMFVRLSVQNIRFLLMFFAFIELYEIIMSISLIQEDLDINYTYLINNLVLNLNLQSFLYNLLVNLPIFLLKYFYQLVHLLFIITSHFFAYIALVFWLFSFLYTSFFDTKMENHFKILRKKYN
jgi:hypothetical protein